MLGNEYDMRDWIFEETTVSKLMKGNQLGLIMKEKLDSYDVLCKKTNAKVNKIKNLEIKMEDQAISKKDEIYQDRRNRISKMEHIQLRSADLLDIELKSSKKERVYLLEKQHRYECILVDDTAETEKKIDAIKNLKDINSV